MLIEQVGKLEKGEKSSSRVGKIIWHLRVGSNLMTSTAWKHKHRKRYLLWLQEVWWLQEEIILSLKVNNILKILPSNCTCISNTLVGIFHEFCDICLGMKLMLCHNKFLHPPVSMCLFVAQLLFVIQLKLNLQYD